MLRQSWPSIPITIQELSRRTFKSLAHLAIEHIHNSASPYLCNNCNSYQTLHPIKCVEEVRTAALYVVHELDNRNDLIGFPAAEAVEGESTTGPHYFSQSSLTLKYCITVMACKLPLLPLVRRGITAPRTAIQYTARACSHFPPARRRRLFQQSTPSRRLIDKRHFSTTPWRQFADVDDTSDPRQQDRESDEVDVCIVGGGMHSCTPLRYPS